MLRRFLRVRGFFAGYRPAWVFGLACLVACASFVGSFFRAAHPSQPPTNKLPRRFSGPLPLRLGIVYYYTVQWPTPACLPTWQPRSPSRGNDNQMRACWVSQISCYKLSCLISSLPPPYEYIIAIRALFVQLCTSLLLPSLSLFLAF